MPGNEPTGVTAQRNKAMNMSTRSGWTIRYRRLQSGVTLLELMIVVAIVGVLATLATSSYTNYVLRANRVDATSTMLQIRVAQEKFFLQNNRYALPAEINLAPPAGLGIPVSAIGLTPKGRYTITMVTPSATTYTLQADTTALQAGDIAACHTYQTNQNGDHVSPADSTGCWK
jgi:type IV pilus assembly protein PilE